MGGACSGYLLEHDGAAVQLELGCGTLVKLMDKYLPEQLEALVLSHWHYDHCSDLLPLMYRMEAVVGRRGQPLHVYAPVDEQSLVRGAVQASSGIVLHDVHPGDVMMLGGMQFTFQRARHPVPGMIMRIEQGGKSLCYTGDTNTCEMLADMVHGVDLMLADGLLPHEAWQVNKPHLSAVLCAQLAKEEEVKRLVITHLNPDVDVQALIVEARRWYPEARVSRMGDVYIL